MLMMFFHFQASANLSPNPLGATELSNFEIKGNRLKRRFKNEVSPKELTANKAICEIKSIRIHQN